MSVSSEPPRATLAGVALSKFYGHVKALDGVSVDFEPGLNAVIGDNGAGKSTLMKIFSGVLTQDEGEVLVDGETVRFESARSARAVGIEALYQDLALVDTMSIAENVFLGRELSRRVGGLRVVDRRKMEGIAQAALDEIHIRMPSAQTGVKQLSGGQRQAVAVARAMHFGARVLLLDEPTAALGPRETAAFMEVIRHAVAGRRTVVMVGHNLPQVLEVADRIIVMRAGKVVGRFLPSETSLRELTEFMVG